MPRIPAFRGATLPAPTGATPLLSSGGSTTIMFGVGTDFDRLLINNVPAGPHLTGPAGPPGPPGSSSGAALALGPFDKVITDPPFNASTSLSDNTVAIQQAIDTAIASLLLNGNYLGAARVIVPSTTSTFSCRTPLVIDYNLVELVGIDHGSKLAKIGPGPLIIISERRSLSANVGGVDTVLTPVAANRPDAFGVLDASACPSAGARRGFRTLGTCYARFLGGPPMMGVLSSAGGGMTDNWSETTKLTIEWMFKVNGGSVIPARAPLFGLGGQDPAIISPFLVTTGDVTGKITIGFRTSDVLPGETIEPTMYRNGSFMTGSGSGPFKIAAQIDLDNAVICYFVNGIQVGTVQAQNLGPTDPFPWLPGTTFAVNDDSHFMFGSDNLGSTSGSTGGDFTFYALRVSNSLRYQNRGVGQAQWLVGQSRGPTDAEAYFSDDSHTVFYLPFTDPADTSRWFSVHCGGASLTPGGTDFGWIDNAYNQPGTTANAVRNLFLVTGGGPAIVVGPAQDLKIIGVRTQATHGILFDPRFANYDHEITDLTADCTDCAVSFFRSIVNIRNLVAIRSGRVTVRGRQSGGTIDGLFIERATPITSNIFKGMRGDYGGDWKLVNVLVDYEGNQMTGHNASVFYMEAHNAVPGCALRLEGIFLATVGPAASVIRLRNTSADTNTGDPYPQLYVSDIISPDPTVMAQFDIDGGRWRGELSNTAGLKGNLIRHTGRWSTACNIVLHDWLLNAVPTTGKYYVGGHFIHKLSPGVGDPLGWICVVSGDFSTGTHPRFAPVGVVGALVP